MADKKISQLDASAALTGTEEVPVVQSGATVKTTVQDIANKAPGIGFTPENVANKSINTALGTSNTLYPTQNAVKVYVDGSVAGLLDDRGSYTPSVSSPGAYPSTGGSGTAGAIMKGDLWFMSASGFLGTTAVAAGATVRALVNTPGQTGANWNILSAGAISITTPTLDDVTTAGNISSNSMTINTDGGGYMAVTTVSDFGQASLNALLGQGGSMQLRNTFGSIGTIKADNLGVNRTYQLPDAAGTLALTSQVGLPYLVYSALIIYESAGIELVTLLQNTLGATITFGARSGSEFPINASSSVFTSNKTIVIATQYWNGSATFSSIGTRISGTQVKMQSVNGSGGSSVSYGYPIFIEIRVYP